MLQSYFKKTDTKHDVRYLSTGAELRAFATGDSYMSKQVARVLENGGLLPPFLPIWIWTTWLIENYSGTEHIILDGVARRENEAPILENALIFLGIKNVYVILLSISRDEATKRLLKRGRDDDTEKDIKNRLDWFESEVMPAVDHFRTSSGIQFLDINGQQSEEAIHNDIIEKISNS